MGKCCLLVMGARMSGEAFYGCGQVVESWGLRPWGARALVLDGTDGGGGAGWSRGTLLGEGCFDGI